MSRRRRGRLGRALAAAVRLFVTLGVLLALPGVSEAVEDTAHWLGEGHTVHDGEDGCETECGEHGCSGLQHLCRCCPTPQLLPPPEVAHRTVVGGRPSAPSWTVVSGVGIDAQAPALRPPIA